MPESSKAKAAETIILWSHPRSCSTMFERVFLNLEQADWEVLHEPMGDAYYFGPERCNRRYPQSKIDSQYAHHKELDFAKCWRQTTKPSQPGSRIFSKDMAQYLFHPPTAAPTAPPLPDKVDGNPTVIPTKDLLDPKIKHTFLIRHPQLAVPSYYRLCSGDKRAVTGFEFYDPEETGLHESKQLYDFLASRLPEPPLLIDSEDLLAEPVKVMRAYCEHVGVEFDESLLQWQAGSQKHFEKWKGFHDDAEKSSGIGQAHAPVDHQKREQEVKAMPEEVHKAIADNLADYEYLRGKALRV